MHSAPPHPAPPPPPLPPAGQILGGSDPATAARYQIVIMFLIGATTAISAVGTIFMAVLSIVDDRCAGGAWLRRRGGRRREGEWVHGQSGGAGCRPG